MSLAAERIGARCENRWLTELPEDWPNREGVRTG